MNSPVEITVYLDSRVSAAFVFPSQPRLGTQTRVTGRLTEGHITQHALVFKVILPKARAVSAAAQSFLEDVARVDFFFFSVCIVLQQFARRFTRELALA